MKRTRIKSKLVAVPFLPVLPISIRRPMVDISDATNIMSIMRSIGGRKSRKSKRKTRLLSYAM
jgi:hypothetical protein